MVQTQVGLENRAVVAIGGVFDGIIYDANVFDITESQTVTIPADMQPYLRRYLADPETVRDS